MHAVLVSVGTDGDIFPYASLGAELAARGHSVTFVASEQYEELALRHGFAFRSLVTAEENDELFGNPDFWHPFKTAHISAKWGLRFLRRQYELLADVVTPDMMLIANPGVLAAAMVAEKFRVPIANLILQPWMIASSAAPPLMPGLAFLSSAPRPAWKIFWRGLDLLVDTLIGPELNRLRADLDMKPVRRIFHHWLSPRLVIGMFPDWYGPPAADWPSQIRLTAFPVCDDGSQKELPSEVVLFCASGEAPIVFTFGTGMAHCSGLFRAALDASQSLGVRAIFLTKYRDQLPAALPLTVLPCRSAPFAKLFPHCAAVVHHGGIGTVSQAMAAGVPQLIHPICFDQLDNGARVERLGAGSYLRRTPATASQLARALAPLLTPEARSRSRSLKNRFENTAPFTTAADLIESAAKTGCNC